MVDTIFFFAGLCGAICLGIATVDMQVAAIRSESRFSIRSLLVLTAIVSLVLAALVTLIKK